MLYVVIASLQQENEGHYNLQMVANFAMMFILPELHILPRKKCFLARLNYRIQTVAVIMVVATCVCGLHFSFYGKIACFDSIIHFLAGVMLVYVGYYVAFAITQERMSPTMTSITGFGLSCFTALLWEVYEFVFDSITGGSTQGWNLTPEEGYLQITVTEPLRYPLMDTMTDLIFGLSGAVIGGILIRFSAKLKKTKGCFYEE